MLIKLIIHPEFQTHISSACETSPLGFGAGTELPSLSPTLSVSPTVTCGSHSTATVPSRASGAQQWIPPLALPSHLLLNVTALPFCCDHIHLLLPHCRQLMTGAHVSPLPPSPQHSTHNTTARVILLRSPIMSHVILWLPT